jgi:hypothetical protein
LPFCAKVHQLLFSLFYFLFILKFDYQKSDIRWERE